MRRPLYEIDNDLLSCFDEETGELCDLDKFEELQLEREEKIEGVGLAIKNLTADMKAYESEEKAFKAKKETAQKQIEGYKHWLASALNGQKFHSPKVDVKFTKSHPVEVTDISKIPEEFIRETIKREADKKAIKEAIMSGMLIEGAQLIEKENMQVK